MSLLIHVGISKYVKGVPGIEHVKYGTSCRILHLLQLDITEGYHVTETVPNQPSMQIEQKIGLSLKLKEQPLYQHSVLHSR